MAGINLIRQLERAKRNKGGADPALAGSGGGLSAFFARFRRNTDDEGSPGGGLSKEDILGILKLAVGVLALVGAPALVSQYWNAPEEVGYRADVQRLSADIAAQKRELAKSQSLVKEMEGLDKQIAEIKRKITLVQSVLENRNVTVRMVDFIVSEMPDQVWLDEVQLSPAASEANVQIKGYALTMQQVSRFIKKLEGAVYFPTWELIESKEGAATARATGAPVTPPARNERPAGSKEYTIKAKVVM